MNNCSLDGYEIMVMDDAQFSFTLKPVQGSGAEQKRSWELRAKTENDRVKWVRAFLGATMMFDGTLRPDTVLETENAPKRKVRVARCPTASLPHHLLTHSITLPKNTQSRWGSSIGSFIGGAGSGIRGRSQASEDEMAKDHSKESTKMPMASEGE